jgi:predicted ATPase
VLAPVLWAQGYPEQAMQTVERGVADALAAGHALTLCNMLAQSACPVALLNGDLVAAGRFTQQLLDTASRYGLDIWRAHGDGFHGILLFKQGEQERGLTRLRNATIELRRASFTQYYTAFIATLANFLGAAGQIAQALTAIDEALARCELTSERWCLPELLRCKGELVLLRGQRESARAAEELFRRAVELARRQGALSWELRTANSLARLLQGTERRAEARDLLAPILGRLTEGHDTADPRTARELLAG